MFDRGVLDAAERQAFFPRVARSAAALRFSSSGTEWPVVFAEPQRIAELAHELAAP